MEFVVDEARRFEALCVVYDELRKDKEAGVFRPDEEWRELFGADALARFWWPSEAEAEAHMARWWATPVPQRFEDPGLRPPSWIFGSLLEAFQNLDAVLLGGRRVEADRGRLEFEPNGWPFGGTGCLRMLAEAFGCRVVGEDDGSGYREVAIRESRA